MRYELFVLQLKMLKAYEESKEDIEREIDDIIYQYCGVRGIRYDKERSSYNQFLSQETYYLMSERLKEPESQLDYTIYAINQLEPIVNETLLKLPRDVQLALKLHVYEHKSFDSIGKLFGYTKNGIWAKVKREVEKI